MPTIDEIDELLEDPAGYRRKKKKRPAYDLSPEDESTILGSLAGGAMSGLSFVGSTLDEVTGSRALRGLLAGKPQEVLSMLPWTDEIGDFTEENLGVRIGTDRKDNTRGWQLMGLDKEPDLFSPEGAASLGVEVLLDPTLPFTGFFKGGLTAAGKGLKAAGALNTVTKAATSTARKAGGFIGPRVFKQTSSLRKVLADPIAHGIDDVADLTTRIERKTGPLSDELLDMPLGANLEFWPTGTTFNVPGGRTLAKGMDAVGDVLRHGEIPGLGYSPGDHLAQLFSGRVAGMGTREFQEALGQVSDELPSMGGEKLRPVHQLADDLQTIPYDERALMRELEGIEPKGPVAQQFDPIIDNLNKTYGKGWTQGSFKPPLKDEFVQHGVGRRANLGPNYRKGIDEDEFTEHVLQTASGAAMKRSDALRNLTRGGDTLNEMLSDPAVLNAANVDDLTRHLETHWSMSAPTHSHEQFEALADTLQSFKKSWDTDSMAYTGEAIPNFWRHPLEAASEASRSSPRRVKYQGAAMKALAEGIKATKGSGQTVPLGSVLDAAGLFRGEDEAFGSLPEMARQLGIAPPPAGATKKELAAWRSEIANTPVPEKYMADVKRLKGLFESPEEVGKLLDFYDSMTGMFKAGVLTWPARYARDFFGGQFNNIATGQWSPWSVKAGHDFLQAREIDALSIPLIRDLLAKDGLPATQENANKVLRAHLAAMGILHQSKGTSAQIASGAAKQADRNSLEGLIEAIPGKKPVNLTAAKDAFTSGDAWPHHIEGVFGAKETKFAPVKVGNVAGNYTDSMNRLPPYLELLKQGVDPKEAYQRVMAAQVDYSNAAFSAFERGTMQRIVPFWKFQRSMLPFVLGKIIDEPSGRLAQVVRGQGRASEDDQFLPSHLRQGMALPIPGAPPGFGRVLTGLGLMHEDPLGMIRPEATAYKTAQGIGQELLGRTNPFLKAPFEIAAGKQMFSGRELQDLEGNLSQITKNLTGQEVRAPILLEQAVSNSPVSRVATTVRTLSDKRKWPYAAPTNLLTGVRVSDYDKERSSNIATRELLEDILRGEPGVRVLRPHLYVPEEDMPRLSEKEKKLLALYKILGAKAQKAAREKKKKAS